MPEIWEQSSVCIKCVVCNKVFRREKQENICSNCKKERENKNICPNCGQIIKRKSMIN